MLSWMVCDSSRAYHERLKWDDTPIHIHEEVMGALRSVGFKVYVALYVQNIYIMYIIITYVYIYMPANVGIPMYLGIFLSFYM